MKKEKSCGCIIINNEKVLLIKQNKGHWGFPKGHVEQEETEVQTAKREVKEETNIDVEIYKDYKYVMNYITDKGIDKEVVFFIAKMIGGQELPQQEEVSEIKWVKLEEAFDVLTYENSKELFKRVLKDYHLNKKG